MNEIWVPESPPPEPRPATAPLEKPAVGAATLAASGDAAGAPVRWRPARGAVASSWPMPSRLVAMRRGFLCRCPACGKSDLFRGYLRVADACPVCAAPLGQARADDAPPYFTIFIVGHLIVLMMLTVERHWQLSLWLSAAIWLPLTLVLSLVLLRPIKGATVGLMLTVGLMKPSA